MECNLPHPAAHSNGYGAHRNVTARLYFEANMVRYTMLKPTRASDTIAPPIGDSLVARIGNYDNSAELNEELHREFTARANEIPFLKAHRDWVEKTKWGFGDRAFHYMWLLVTQHLCSGAFRCPPSVLEIGVYKGQVLSLLALCARQLSARLDLYAISPFKGTRNQSRIVHALRRRLQPSYRKSLDLGNLYEQGDYLEACEIIFREFGLDFSSVTLFRGMSTDAEIYKRVDGRRFTAIYIDGDHSLEVVRQDLVTYSPLIEKGGLLIMDDASCDLPGEGYFKGYSAVSTAARIVPSLGFENVLNIGHNRIYRRN